MSAQPREILFAEDQSFRQLWVWGLMLATLMVLVACLGAVGFLGPGKGDLLQGVLGLSGGIAVVIAVAVLMYNLKLSVRVDGEALHVRFFPLVKKDIPLGQIAHWEARTYRPILEYGGWGIRCSWKGMAYNVSGKRGVQLELANGKRLLIGSQHADELAAAITRAKRGG